MSFKLFQAYILLTFFRPVELFMPELGELRPMLWLWLLAVITSVVAAAAKKDTGARPIHFKLIFGLWALIGVSKLLSPWSGGTMEAISDRHTVKPVSQDEERTAASNMARMLGPPMVYVYLSCLNDI